jgi:hypothetical protein
MEIKRGPKLRTSNADPAKAPKWRNLYVHRNGKGHPSPDLFFSADQAKFWTDERGLRPRRGWA